jgi:GNAT superfamily N-acetyltransferase
LFKTLIELLADSNAAIFVAEVDGRVIALAEVYLRQDESSLVKVAYPYGYLQSLMVDPAFRGGGVGTQLVRAAEDWAKARGAAEMRLETWEFVAGPLPFYESIGYTTLRRTLSRSLAT